MRRRNQVISRFTPLLESGTGLRSRSTGQGRRVYKGVTIIKAGLGNARDRNYYPISTLEKAVDDGRFEGLRAYADHPDSVSEEIQPERTVRDMVGVYTNSKFTREGKTGGRVVADLNLFRSAKWLSDTVDDLLDLGQADKIGLSINGRGKTVERRMPLEESGDEQDVNFVEDFLVLRSGDVVTEAGAGGGFQHLLESARGTKTKETAMQLTGKQKKAIKEAVDTSNYTALGKLLKECGCSLEDAVTIAKEGTAPAKGSKAAKSTKEAEKGKKKSAAAAPVEEAEDEDVEEADEDAEEVDHDAELDEAVDEVNDEAGDDVDEAEDDAEDEDGDDVAEGDDELEEDDEESEPVETRRGDGRHPLASASEKIRQAADRRRSATKEGGVTIARQLNKKIKGPGNGKTAVNIIGTRRTQNRGGRRSRESGTPDLETQNTRLREENARLSSQLRVRTTADRARRLLRESAIPEKMRPDILRLMVGKSEGEMQRIVRYHERLISAAVQEATYGDAGDGRVEGAGARVRESFGGEARADDFGSLFEEVGIPIRSDE